MTKEKKAVIRKWVTCIGLDIVVIWGFLATDGVSGVYNGFLTFLHICLWIQVFTQTALAIACLFFETIIEKIGIDQIDVANAGDDEESKLKSIASSLLVAKVGGKKWSHRVYAFLVTPAMLGFIAFKMQHWSLFFVWTLAWLTSQMLFKSASVAYDKLPIGWKGEDLDGDGVPDDEAEMIRKASMNPVSKAIVEAKEKKEEEQKKVVEARESLVDNLLEPLD